MGHRISDEDWEAFEKLTFQALLAVFNLTANDRNQLTQRKKDGGFDEIFFFPAELTTDAHSFFAIMEAKLRNDITRDLPLQDFSKAMIIAINRAAQLLVVASNLRLSNKTVELLQEFSKKTGLKVQYLSIKTIYEQLQQDPELKNICPTSLLELLARSYNVYLNAQKNFSAMEEISVCQPLFAPKKVALFSAERRKNLKEIIALFKQSGGLVTVEGYAGIGKSFFTAAVRQELELDGFGVIHIDLQNCDTSRVLFIKLVQALWCIPQKWIEAIGLQDFSQAITWVGDNVLNPSIKKAVIIAFQKSKSVYLKHADLFYYYLIEYLAQLYSQVRKQRKYIVCFTNLNYAQKDLLEFLIQFLKRFDKDIRTILEIRTSVYIDGHMQDEEWEYYVSQFQQLPCLLYRCKLHKLTLQEYRIYINTLLNGPQLGILETKLILEKAGYTLLLINTLLVYLKTQKFLELPQFLWADNIASLPVDHGQQIIPMLVDTLSTRGPYYSGLFFLTGLFQGHIDLSMVEQILGNNQDALNDLLQHTDIYTLAQKQLHITHTLYLDYFITGQYLTITYQQELARKVLTMLEQTPPFVSQEEEAICRIRIYEILGELEEVAVQSLDFGISTQQYGQYGLSQTYIKLAEEHLAILESKNPSLWVSRHIESLLALLQNELYLQEMDRENLQEKLTLLNECLEKVPLTDREQPKIHELNIRASLVRMRLYHYWGDYRTSLTAIECAVKELCEDTPTELVGRVWLEYAIATKETTSLNQCLQVFRQGRKHCPRNTALLFSNLTHLSEKYSTINASIAMRYLELIEPLKEHLPLSSQLHHAINIATMRMYCGDYELSQEEGLAIIRQANQAGLKNEEARCSNLLGCLAYIRGNYPEAERNLTHGRALIPEAKHVTVLWPILSNLFSVQQSQKQWDQALDTACSFGKILRKSYVDRINHLKIAPGKYPKLFAGILLLLRGLLVMEKLPYYAEPCQTQIQMLLSAFHLKELNDYYIRLQQGERLESILQKTPFYQAGKLVIKS